MSGCVGGSKGEGAECDADVKIGEDQLDAGEVSQDDLASELSRDSMEDIYVGRSRVAHGIVKIL